MLRLICCLPLACGLLFLTGCETLMGKKSDGPAWGMTERGTLVRKRYHSEPNFDEPTSPDRDPFASLPDDYLKEWKKHAPPQPAHAGATFPGGSVITPTSAQHPQPRQYGQPAPSAQPAPTGYEWATSSTMSEPLSAPDPLPIPADFSMTTAGEASFSTQPPAHVRPVAYEEPNPFATAAATSAPVPADVPAPPPVFQTPTTPEPTSAGVVHAGGVVHDDWQAVPATTPTGAPEWNTGGGMSAGGFSTNVRP